MSLNLDIATALDLTLSPEFEAKLNALKLMQLKKLKQLTTSLDAKEKEITKLKVLGKDNRRTQMIEAYKEKIKGFELTIDVLKEELGRRAEMSTEEVNEVVIRKTISGPKRFRPATREELENKSIDLERKMKKLQLQLAKAQTLAQTVSTTGSVAPAPPPPSRENRSVAASTTNTVAAKEEEEAEGTGSRRSRPASAAASVSSRASHASSRPTSGRPGGGAGGAGGGGGGAKPRASSTSRPGRGGASATAKPVAEAKRVEPPSSPQGVELQDSNLVQISNLTADVQRLEEALQASEHCVELQQEELTRLRVRIKELAIKDEEITQQEEELRNLRKEKEDLTEKLMKSSNELAGLLTEIDLLKTSHSFEKDILETERDKLSTECQNFLTQNTVLLKRLSEVEQQLDMYAIIASNPAVAGNRAASDGEPGGAIISSTDGSSREMLAKLSAYEGKLTKLQAKLKTAEAARAQLATEVKQVDGLMETLREKNVLIRQLQKQVEFYKQQQHQQQPSQPVDCTDVVP